MNFQNEIHYFDNSRFTPEALDGKMIARIASNGNFVCKQKLRVEKSIEKTGQFAVYVMLVAMQRQPSSGEVAVSSEKAYLDQPTFEKLIIAEPGTKEFSSGCEYVLPWPDEQFAE